jgi:2-polyprenyl-3-methyl-5-hydroxy-6-metoxy-1,4-benzoquinol methylase
MTYDPKSLSEHYDAYGEREWDRLGERPQGRIKYAIHKSFLDRCVETGMKVLDVGCGPGRFAIDIIRMGATVTLADISQVQLDLAAEHIGAAELTDRIDGSHLTDVANLEAFEDGAFDLVVCFGGAVSYTLERHRNALSELARVVRPGGDVLISVMSLYGTLRLLGPLDANAFLANADQHLDWAAVLGGEATVHTVHGSREFHQPMVLFSSEGLRSAMIETGFTPIEMGSANPIVSNGASIPAIVDDAAALEAMTELELASCRYPGLLDAGEHLIARGRKS